jgi:hypothetical protein
VAVGGVDGCGRRPREVDLGEGLAGEAGRQARALDAEEAAVEVERAAVPHAPQHVEELGRAGVPVVVVDLVAPPQLGRATAFARLALATAEDVRLTLFPARA